MCARTSLCFGSGVGTPFLHSCGCVLPHKQITSTVSDTCVVLFTIVPTVWKGKCPLEQSKCWCSVWNHSNRCCTDASEVTGPSVPHDLEWRLSIPITPPLPPFPLSSAQVIIKVDMIEPDMSHVVLKWVAFNTQFKNVFDVSSLFVTTDKDVAWLDGN